MRRLSHKLLCLIAIVSALGVGLTSAQGRTGTDVLDLIDAAASSGQLNYETALLYKVRAIRSPQSLPEPYRTAATSRPIKCGTPVAIEAMQAAPTLSADFQSEVEASFQRPEADSVYYSPGGHFVIHYSLSGVDAVSGDDFDASGFPDFIEDLALYFDSAWAYEVDELGWGPPPFDGTAGGDSLYDVYPSSIGFTYGLTLQDSPGPAPWDDFSSYILVNKAFIGFPSNDDPEGDKAGSMKSTAAHEFNHACQFADNPLHWRSSESWWQEITATWMEDVVYDTVNDNYNYLDEFFPVPQISLYDGGDHKYGAFVFGKYIEENFGVDLVRQAWITMRGAPAVPALDTALRNAGSSFKEAFQTFTGWNYFTGSRDDGLHYEEGARYLEVPITRVESTYPLTDRAGAVIQSMAADYIELLPDPADRDVVEFEFNGPSIVRWNAALWLIDSTANAEELPVDVDTLTGDGTAYFGGFDQLDRTVLVTTNVKQIPSESNYLYSLNFLARADCNYDGGANVQDILYLVDFIYADGSAPQPIWQVGDLNCSGGIEVLDVSVAIDYILRGGETPCPPLD